MRSVTISGMIGREDRQCVFGFLGFWVFEFWGLRGVVLGGNLTGYNETATFGRLGGVSDCLDRDSQWADS